MLTRSREDAEAVRQQIPRVGVNVMGSTFELEWHERTMHVWVSGLYFEGIAELEERWHKCGKAKGEYTDK